MVPAQEGFLVAAVAGHFGTRQPEEPFGDVLAVHQFVGGLGVQVAVDLLGDAVAGKEGPADEEGILQIHLVLLVVVVVGEFRVARQGQFPGGVGGVGHRQLPHFMGAVLGHIVDRFGVDARIVGEHPGVAHAVAAFAGVVLQVLAHRLPGSRPEIPAGVVPQVEVPAGAVELVEDVAQDAAVGAGLGKAVAAGVVGDDGAVLRRAEIVLPRGRGYRGAGPHTPGGHRQNIRIASGRILLVFIPVPP